MARRCRKTPRMELYRRRAPDYTELAYREALAKLKYLLAESYNPVHRPLSTGLAVAEKEAEGSVYPVVERAAVPPFLRRQEEYIHQLEKEGQLYREELSRVLDRIKDVPDKPLPSEEDESDRDVKERSRRGRGPSIVYSSRISELEAQLTQVRLELRKAQDEAAYLKAHSKPIQPPVSQHTVQQLEALQRERDDLNERVTSLQALVSQLRDKESSATQKVKRSLDVVDQAQYDKNQLEMEVRRLKSELERMSDKQREALQESARRVSEAERRYAMQIERLNGDLAAQWDAANRLNLELDRARRTEAELRRELAQKIGTIEELKKELLTKTGSLQNEALTAAEEREKLEGELSACKLSIERAERQGRQEVARLQAEVQALRARLDRADQDLLYSRKENIRLADVIAGLEKELSLSKLTKDSAASKESKKADELTSMIKEMDAKHEESKSELEALIHSQTQLMEKLNSECQALTRRLEESAARHKEEMASLQNNVAYLSSKIEAPDHFRNQDWRDDDKLEKYEDQAGIVENIHAPTDNIDDNSKPLENKNATNLGKSEEKNETNQLEGKTEAYPTKSEYDATKDGNFKENFGKNAVPDYKDEGYEKSGEVAYNQEQNYNEPNVAYDSNQGYDPNQGKEYQKEDYPQEKEYQQPEYAEGKEYQEQGYSGTEGYDQGQAYGQPVTGEYLEGSGYEAGDYGGQAYQDGQGYDPSYQQEGYDQGQLYQDGYQEGQGYPQEGQVYSQEGEVYPQEGQVYPQEGEVYTGAGEVYQPEGYQPTDQAQHYPQQPHNS